MCTCVCGGWVYKGAELKDQQLVFSLEFDQFSLDYSSSGCSESCCLRPHPVDRVGSLQGVVRAVGQCVPTAKASSLQVKVSAT